MSLKTWFRDNRNDEREDMITARAAMWGFSAISIACIALAIAWMVANRVSDALTMAFVVSLGQAFYLGYILRMKAAR